MRNLKLYKTFINENLIEDYIRKYLDVELVNTRLIEKKKIILDCFTQLIDEDCSVKCLFEENMTAFGKMLYYEVDFSRFLNLYINSHKSKLTKVKIPRKLKKSYIKPDPLFVEKEGIQQFLLILDSCLFRLNYDISDDIYFAVNPTHGQFGSKHVRALKYTENINELSLHNTKLFIKMLVKPLIDKKDYDGI